MCPAAGTTDFFDIGAAAGAGGALFAKYLEVVAIVTGSATGVGEMLEGSTANGDGVTHDVAGGQRDGRRLSFGNGIGSPGWFDLGGKEGFVDVDVAEARDEFLI